MANKISKKVQLKKLESLLIPIDKLSDVLFDIEKQDADEIIENRKLDITTPIIVTRPKDSFGNDIPTNPFDKLIFWIALSEQNAGNSCVSHTRIFHSLGGGENFAHASNVKAAIVDSLRKLRLTNLHADLTALTSRSKSYKKTLEELLGAEIIGQKVILEDSLLPTKTVTASINGKISDGVIYFHDFSILLTIAEMKKQIAHCDPALLDVPNLRCTVQTLSLKALLLERILKIKGSLASNRKRVQKLNNILLFDSIFSKCGLNDEGRNRKAEFRAVISKILTHFVNQKLISSFEFTQKNGKFYSIIITF